MPGTGRRPVQLFALLPVPPLAFAYTYATDYAEVKDYPALPFGAYGGVEWKF